MKEQNEKKGGHFLSLRTYIMIFVVIAVICSLQIIMYATLADDVNSNMIIAPLVLIYILFVTIIAGFIIIAIRYYSYEIPMKRLGETIEQVSKGDFSVRIKPLKNNKDDVFINATYRDFNKMVEDLGSIETLKNDFISNVSHEIKTPLAIIRNYASVLQDEGLPKEARAEYASTIINASDRLSSLITNILKLNKLENQEIVTQHTTFSLSEQLRNSALSYENLWEEKNISLLIDLEEVSIVSDEGMLELVWNNLISNAIKYTESDGEIEINLKTKNNIVEVQIRDTGCGMDEDTVQYIFTKFYQGDTSHSENGNGLGLALVQRIIEILDGDISVISEKGVGSTFIVKLKINT